MKAKTTEEGLLDIFNGLNGRVDFPVCSINRKVAIISTPRCGSSMFCDILHNTGCFGDPKEWINMRYILAYAKLFNVKKIDINEYLDFVMRKTTSLNGLFSINFHVLQYVEMLKRKVDVLNAGFDNIYFLSRRDKLAQACSLAKATLTDQWSADSRAVDGAGHDRPDKSHVVKALLDITISEEYYEKNLRAYCDREFSYEDFKEIETTDIYGAVLDDCEIEVRFDRRTTFEKQADASDRALVNSLREYLGADH